MKLTKKKVSEPNRMLGLQLPESQCDRFKRLEPLADSAGYDLRESAVNTIIALMDQCESELVATNNGKEAV